MSRTTAGRRLAPGLVGRAAGGSAVRVRVGRQKNDSRSMKLGEGRRTPSEVVGLAGALALSRPLTRPAKARAAVTRLSERLPGSRREPDRDGRSLVIAVARDAAGRPLATTALTGPDPYEMTASLLAWGAVRAVVPDAVLRPGAHGPVAAFGLETLRAGAAEAGVRETREAPPARS